MAAGVVWDGFAVAVVVVREVHRVAVGRERHRCLMRMIGSRFVGVCRSSRGWCHQCVAGRLWWRSGRVLLWLGYW